MRDEDYRHHFGPIGLWLEYGGSSLEPLAIAKGTGRGCTRRGNFRPGAPGWVERDDEGSEY